MADGNYTQFPIPYTVVDLEQMQSDLDTAEQNIETLGTSKAGVNGTYPSLTAGLAEQLLSNNRVTDQTPYLYRQTALGKANATRALMRKIVGGSVVWNQLCNGSFVTVPSDHKYAAKIGGSWSISASTGTAITGLTAGTDMVTDLTALFGSATIADYIYSLEQATAGSGIAKLKEWGFFGEDYYEYDAGTMRSVEGVSVKITRDADQNVIGNYPLDSSLTLRGIPKLDSNNNLYYDGDEYAADGTVTRRYALVDLGTLSWTYDTIGTNPLFYTNDLIDLIKKSSNVIRIVCSRYTSVTGSSITTFRASLADKCIGETTSGSPTGRIVIHDSSYTDAASFKTAMSGVYLVYELATPTTETAEPFTEVQVVDKDGTEQFVTTGIVPVGHVTEYPENLLDKLQHLPDLASADGDYIIRQTGTQMSLAPASGGGGGGGAVSSVNGKTGAVVLDADDVGAIAPPSSPASGAFLVWNGSAWVAQTLATWEGSNY